MARGSFGMKLFVGVIKAIAKAGKSNSPKAVAASRRTTKGRPHCTSDISSISKIDNRNVSSSGGVAKATVFLPPIPEGYQIYKRMLYVVGITFRKSDASPFIRSSCHSLEFEREPNNPKDKNAIRVIGVTPLSKYFVGYVPKEISEQLVKTGLLDKVQPRLDRTYHGINDFVEIRFQIIGPKEYKKQFDVAFKNKPADAGQKMFLKYFGLPIPRGLSTEQAKQTINSHQEKLSIQDPFQLQEYSAYVNIFDEFDDRDFRASYDVKKTSMDVLQEALFQLKQEGHTYYDLDIEDVVDRVIKLKPELARTTY